MKVTFVCSGLNSTPFSEYIPFSKYLNGQNVETSFLLDNNVSEKTLKALENGNRVYYTESKPKPSSGNSVQTSKNQKSKIGFLKRIPILKSVYEYLSGYKAYRAAIANLSSYDKIAAKVLSKEQPDCIILYGDRNLTIVPPAIKFARSNNIPLVVLQVAASMKSILLHGRLNKIENSESLLINQYLKRKFPQQWTLEGDKSYSFYSWHLTLALSKLGMLPNNPWYDGDSWANKHLLISEQNLIAKRNDGSLCSNSIVVGQFSHDLLHENYVNKESIKQKLDKKYFNKNGKPFIIIAFPQFWEHNLMPREEAFKEIDALVNQLSLIEDFNVLVSLHPKMKYEHYVHYEQKAINLKIAKDERLSYILPAGQLFLSTFESTTSWALLCKIVPIYLNYYGYGFTFNNFPGALSIDKKENMSDDLKAIIKNLNIHQSNLSKGKNQNLPPFDGFSGERILNQIKELVN